MTNLNKPIKRISAGLVKEAGHIREVVVILRPPNVIGFRAKGCRREYQLTTESCYSMAVKAHVAYQQRQKRKEHQSRKSRHSLYMQQYERGQRIKPKGGF